MHCFHDISEIISSPYVYPGSTGRSPGQATVHVSRWRAFGFSVQTEAAASAAAAAAAAAAPWSGCVRAAACEETPERDRLSWHELTYESDMETKPFLSLGKFVCLMTKPCRVMSEVFLIALLPVGQCERCPRAALFRLHLFSSDSAWSELPNARLEPLTSWSGRQFFFNFCRQGLTMCP